MKFKEIVSLQRGFDLPNSQRTVGAYPLVASNGTVDYVSKPRCKGPGVVTGRSGTIGKVFYVEEDYWPLNTTLFVTDFHGNEPKYISYWLSTIDLARYANGASVPTLNRNELSEVDCHIHSLEEQRHIVDAIGSIDDLIEKDSKIVSKALLAARLHYDTVVLSDPLATLVPFESLLENCTTGLNPRKNFRLGEGECFYVTIKNMDGDNIILDDRCDKITKEAVCKIQCRSKIKSGCTLFSGIGTIGRTFLCREQPINWNISESVFCFTPKKGIPPEFVYECVNSREFQDFTNINASGAAQKGIRMADLKAHLVPLIDASAMKEYENTAKVFLSIVGSKQREISELKKAKAILLDRYFTNR